MAIVLWLINSLWISFNFAELTAGTTRQIFQIYQIIKAYNMKEYCALLFIFNVK